MKLYRYMEELPEFKFQKRVTYCASFNGHQYSYAAYCDAKDPWPSGDSLETLDAMAVKKIQAKIPVIEFDVVAHKHSQEL